jgi:adenosylcobinamide-GDP ribazoletransferase
VNPVRLALGTLTALPVPAPTRVDRRVAGRAMVLAPLVGALLGVLVGAGLWLLGGGSLRAGAVPPLLAAGLAVGALALLTRGIHLDGLADTADGLGSARPPAQALEVMRRSDVGPFGVATLVLTLLVQVAALSTCLQDGRGPGALVLGLVVGRAALPLVCSAGIPAARVKGLGSTVAGSVPRWGSALGVLVAVAATVAVVVAGGLGDGRTAWLGAAVAVLLPLALAGWLCRRCVRRLGGVTGDVLGACVEVATTATWVVLAIV